MEAYRTQNEIGERIRDLRKQAGLSQGELADTLGVDQTAISRIESGERTISARLLVLMSDRFGVGASEILKKEDSLALLRAGDADSVAVKASMDEFRSCIEDYFGVAALVA